MRRFFQAFLPPLLCVLLGHSPAFAQCTIPFPFTAGDLSNGTQVTVDLNELAVCGLRPSGSPASGAITVFEGPELIGEEDLSGDVNTAGSTATVLSNTGVSAGSYAGTNLTVAADGMVLTAGSSANGGSGIPEAPFVVPTVASFDVTRVGTGALADFTDLGVSGVRITAPATTTNSKSLIYGVDTITAGSGGWRVTARIRRVPPFAQWGTMGVILRDAVSGRSVVYGLGFDSSPGVYRNQYSSDTSLASSAQVVPWYELDLWMRVVDDLTNRRIYLSKDGFDWQEIFSELRTAYATPTQAGVYFDPNFGTTNNLNGKDPVTAKVYSVLVESIP